MFVDRKLRLALTASGSSPKYFPMTGMLPVKFKRPGLPDPTGENEA